MSQEMIEQALMARVVVSQGWKKYHEGLCEELKVDPSNGGIFFIRHGESEAYKNVAATHSSKVHLTSHGKKQAKEISQCFLSAPDHIFFSSYARAWETALPTLRRFFLRVVLVFLYRLFLRVVLVFLYRLFKGTAQPTLRCFFTFPYQKVQAQEFTYLGSLDGVQCTMQGRRAKVDDYWTRCDPEYRDGNGESFAMFIARVDKVIEELRQESGSCLVFTHEQFIIAVQGRLEKWISAVPTKSEMQLFRKVLLGKYLSHPYGQIVELPEHLDPRKVTSQDKCEEESSWSLPGPKHKPSQKALAGAGV